MVTLQKDKKSPEAVFSQWEQHKLVEYAASITKALAAARQKNEALQERVVATQHWLQETNMVEDIGQHLSSILDLDEVLTLLLRRVLDTLSATEGSILLTEEPSGDLVFQTSLGSISDQIKAFRVPKGEGIAGKVALTGVPIRIDNAQQDSGYFKQIDQNTGFLTESILCVPLITRKKIIGVIEVFNKKGSPFTDHDQIQLSSIANFAAIAIENARLHRNVLEERDRVIQAQEKASRKLQRDLHDGPTQLVAAIQMGLDFSKKALEKDPSLLAAELDNMEALAKRATHQMRTLLFELRPLVLETQGMVAALETFIERRQQDVKTKLHLEVNSAQPNNEISRLQPKAEMAIFAIVQETVNNALKHAKADNVFVKLKQQEQTLDLTILDDGVGFDMARVASNYEDRGSYGMINIKERAEVAGGILQMKSAIGAGTEFFVRVPVPTDDFQQAQN